MHLVKNLTYLLVQNIDHGGKSCMTLGLGIVPTDLVFFFIKTFFPGGIFFFRQKLTAILGHIFFRSN